ncbi:FecR family protein [Arcicella aurantiaca]|uniref:FecR family protein n=1 Tax=Arcicella aurantiaca TaxID=591202 RepID=A0A316EB78_9BACT|nr:FecR family protein [Arcicella aurantiaca]PWK27672.1 FecR family protein [Arcicella aurantiaca]
MNNYTTYSPEELAQDSYFIKWINHADLEAEHFWQNWLEIYPFKRKDVELARQMVLLANKISDSTFSQQEINELKNSILEEIEAYEKPVKKGIYKFWMWSAAAAVIIAIGIFWNQQSAITPEHTYAAQVERAKNQYELVEVFNQDHQQQVINLADGSSILLKKGSKISYPQTFTKDLREVFLTGEAFFEIAKDPSKPFIVHANQVITKVLGTSFSVKTYPNSPKVSVNVKTGRVAVYLADNEEQLRKTQNEKLEGLVLLPGERIVVEDKIISPILPQMSVVAVPNNNVNVSIERISFEFNETNLSEVFNRIEQAYHLDVEYDAQHLGNCPVTASLTDEPLNQKLHLICKAVRANYQLKEGKIIITGEGCQ